MLDAVEGSAKGLLRTANGLPDRLDGPGYTNPDEDVTEDDLAPKGATDDPRNGLAIGEVSTAAEAVGETFLAICCAWSFAGTVSPRSTPRVDSPLCSL